jgi:hypothetical protein
LRRADERGECRAGGPFRGPARHGNTPTFHATGNEGTFERWLEAIAASWCSRTARQNGEGKCRNAPSGPSRA